MELDMFNHTRLYEITGKDYNAIEKDNGNVLITDTGTAIEDLITAYDELEERINKAIEYGKSCINEDLGVDKLDEIYKVIFKIAYEIHKNYLKILGGKENE